MGKVNTTQNLSEMADVLCNSMDIIHYYLTVKKGRPPTLTRNHIKSLLKIAMTLLEDIDDCLDKFMPLRSQIENIIKAIFYLNTVKREYIQRWESFNRGGNINDIIPDRAETED